MAATRNNSRTILPPRHLPARVRADWEHLDSPTVAAPGLSGSTATGADDRSKASKRSERSDLPAPVRRWLNHAIDEGAPLHRGARLSMHGEIKVGSWRPFTANQVLTPEGFVWAATAGRFPMRISGFDRCCGGTGEMRWKLAGIVPVMSAADEDTYRSAAGRLAGEMMLLPALAAGDNVRWLEGHDQRATAQVTTGPFTHDVTVGIGDTGALESVSLPRWGDPDGKEHGEHVFGVEMDGEQRFGGYRVPREVRAGWWFGTQRWSEGEFFRATVDAMEFF